MTRWVLLLSAMMLPMNAAAQATERPIVAVIDTGGSIPEVYPNAEVSYYDARSLNHPVMPSGPQYQSRHGTWVASAILERHSGPVKVLSYRTDKECEFNGRCSIDTRVIVRAAMHAVRQGAAVIQISSYGQLDKSAENILAGMAARGTKIVMSAGNESGVTPLAQLALRSPNIHVVGSLNAGRRPSSFSATAPIGRSDLLDWRPGERVVARNPDGRVTHVTGTSFAASLMTADLLGSMAIAQSGIPTVPSVMSVPPLPTVTTLANSKNEDSGHAEEHASEARVALAEAGEVSVDILTAPERSRLLSRAIRPPSSIDADMIGEGSEGNVPAGPAPNSATGRSRALRPGG